MFGCCVFLADYHLRAGHKDESVANTSQRQICRRFKTGFTTHREDRVKREKFMREKIVIKLKTTKTRNKIEKEKQTKQKQKRASKATIFVSC
jgi:hypothetical protein